MAVVNPLIFSSELADAITKTQGTFTLSDSATTKLKTLLGESDHTYLMINDGVNVEVVKVEVVMDELVITRKGGGSSFAFPKGSCVTFQMTDDYIKDFVCSLEDCLPDPIVDECSNCNGGCC
jgi:hypothetical protein